MLSRALVRDLAAADILSVTTPLDQSTGGHSVETLSLAANYPQVIEAAGKVVNVNSSMDVAVIRTVLVPAAMQLLAHRNWSLPSASTGSCGGSIRLRTRAQTPEQSAQGADTLDASMTDMS